VPSTIYGWVVMRRHQRNIMNYATLDIAKLRGCSRHAQDRNSTEQSKRTRSCTNRRRSTMRWIAAAGLVVSGLALLVALALARHDSRIREWLDALKVALGVMAAIVIGALTGVQTPLWLISIAIVLGLLVGVAIGMTSAITMRGDVAFMQRAWIGVAVFATGLVVTQLASLADRYRLVEIGLAVSWFSAASTAGTFFGRRPGIEKARRARQQARTLAPVAGAAMAVGLIALLLGPPVATAQAQSATDQTVWEGPMEPEPDARTSVTIGDNSVTRDYPVTYPGAFVKITRSPGSDDFTIEVDVTINSAKDYALSTEALTALLAADVIDSFYPNFCETSNNHTFNGVGTWEADNAQWIVFEGQERHIETRACELEDLDPYEFDKRDSSLWVQATDLGLYVNYRGHQVTLAGPLVASDLPEGQDPAAEPAEESVQGEEATAEPEIMDDSEHDVDGDQEDAGVGEAAEFADPDESADATADRVAGEPDAEKAASDDKDVTENEAAAVGVTAAAAAVALAAAHAAAQGTRWDNIQAILRGQHIDLPPVGDTGGAAIHPTNEYAGDDLGSERVQDAIDPFPPCSRTRHRHRRNPSARRSVR